MTSRASFPLDAIAVDRDGAKPMHRQLYEVLRAYVLDGRLSAGSGLPATRTLAAELGIGRNTVIAAYDQLMAEGYIEAQIGSGTRVAALSRPATARGRAQAHALRLSRRGRVITKRPQPVPAPARTNLQPGVPDCESFPFSTWARLLAQNAQKRTQDLLSYDRFSGHPRLREVIAEYVGVARGVECSPEQIVVVTGAQAALDLTARVLLDEGDTVWMEEPGYLGALGAFLGSGARTQPLRVKEDGWQLSEPKQKPRLIYVTPACQWPRGAIMRMEERLKLLAIAERTKSWIVEDDYDGEYSLRGRPAPALAGLDRAGRVIYVGTFGKTLFASLRLGFLVVPRELADAFDHAISITGQFAPLLLQATLADFIRQGHFATHLKRMRRLYARRERQFLELCERHLREWMTVSENDSGMQLLGRFTRAFDDREVAAAALRHGVYVQPVSINFHHDPPEHGLLLGYAALGEREMRTAVTALKATFEELGVRD